MTDQTTETVTVSISRETLGTLVRCMERHVVGEGLDRHSRYADRREAAETAYAIASAQQTEFLEAAARALGIELMTAARFTVERGKRGSTVVYTVLDTVKGTIAKTPIADRERAERIAARLNEREVTR